MAAFFVDLDGTFFRYGTNTPLPGAVHELRLMLQRGHQVIFTTAREKAGDAKRVLRELGFEDCLLLGGVQSPRVVVNDAGAFAVNHEMDAPWSPSELSCLPIMDFPDAAFVG